MKRVTGFLVILVLSLGIAGCGSVEEKSEAAKAKEKEGLFPVYAGTIGEPFAYINDFNNTDICYKRRV